jgi:tubulin epsilon
MPRELITVQIGQCGLQVGTGFWDLALREHAAHNRSGKFDEPLSSFFRNVDTRTNPPLGLPLVDSNGKPHNIATLKARAVLVDMEEGVINELLRGSMSDLFDDKQLIKDVSGSGNNFAHGHYHYGPLYGASILEAVRRQSEVCDSLQAFFLMHSLGGGTGSGLGTYILGALEDAYPDIYRFTTCVFPSDQDDVITSPYNSVLSLAQLIQHSDCVLPIHNQALMDICERMNKPIPGQSKHDAAAAASSASLVNPTRGSSSSSSSSSLGNPTRKDKLQRARAFQDMNTLCAQLLTSLTCSMRFEGELNVDLNEITMNLVPFPRLHFLLASLAPLGSTHAQKYTMTGGAASSSSSSSSSASAHDARVPLHSTGASKSIDSMFTSLFSPQNHLVKSNPKHSGVYLACGIFGRGALSVSDLNRNIARMKKTIEMISWNEDGFKIGLCSVPPVGLKSSLLSLSNSSCIADLMSDMYDRCELLYKRRSFFHHYAEYTVDTPQMDEALSLVQGVIGDYAALEGRDIRRKEEQAEMGYHMKQQRMKPL